MIGMGIRMGMENKMETREERNNKNNKSDKMIRIQLKPHLHPVHGTIVGVTSYTRYGDVRL